ncbi:MAG: hypothetical protein ACRCZ0_10990 [Cetobacterium sp.]
MLYEIDGVIETELNQEELNVELKIFVEKIKGRFQGIVLGEIEELTRYEL